MEITKREVIVSISILAIMLIIGFFVGGKISDIQADNNAKYNKAIKIDDKELFEYGMNTFVGNAFVYGEFKAIDVVNYKDINGKYLYIEKVKEEYTRHTREVTETDSKGNVHTRTEVYYTWDEVYSESKTCKKVKFLDIEFKTNKFKFYNNEYIDTVYYGSDIRYVYNGISAKFKGTIFTKLKDGDIGKDIKVYDGMNIKETKEYLESGIGLIIFWVVWILLTGGFIFGFYYLDNDWLNRG